MARNFNISLVISSQEYMLIPAPLRKMFSWSFLVSLDQVLTDRCRDDGLQEGGDDEMDQFLAVDEGTRTHKDDVLGLQSKI